MSSPQRIDAVNITTTSSSAGTVWVDASDIVTSRTLNDPTNWNASSGWNGTFVANEGGDWHCRIAPPNFLQRIIWRALGVTWKDLRPERKLDELGKLK